MTEQIWFLPLISYQEVVTHMLIFCGYCFWLAWFAFWCKNILFELFWNVKHFIAVHYKLMSQVREDTMLNTRRPVYKWLFKMHVTWRQKRQCLLNLSTLSVLANRSLRHSRCRGMVVPKVCLQALPLSLFLRFFLLFPQIVSLFKGSLSPIESFSAMQFERIAHFWVAPKVSLCFKA